MFEAWDSFYLLVGGASGALIGLLFVVATLNSGLDRDAALRGASLYMTPLVFHFAVVLVVSGLALAPSVPAGCAAIVAGLCALAGFAHALRVIIALSFGKLMIPPHWSDVWTYGATPGIFYVGLGVAAAGLGAKTAWGVDAVALATMALLLIGIRNAWDLVTWLAPRARSQEGAGGAS
jgi:hypothetical protein